MNMFKKNLKGRETPHSTARTASLLVLTFIFALVLCGAASADQVVGGQPITTVQKGTVSGGVYSDSYYGFNGAGATGNNNGGTANITYNFASLPGNAQVTNATLYVVVYSGHMQDAKNVNVNVNFNGNNLDTITGMTSTYQYLNGMGDYGGTGNDNSGFTGHSTGEPYLMINDHIVRVTSDYLLQYNVTGLIQQNNVVNVSTIGSFDGRIKYIGLIAPYNDGDNDKIDYWINQGQDVGSYLEEDYFGDVYVGTTTFNTSTITGTVESANLKDIYMASSNGYYGFPNTTNNFDASSGSSAVTGSFTSPLDRSTPDVQASYSGYDSWNVTNDVTTAVNNNSDVTLGYARYFPAGTGLSGYWKNTIAILTVKEQNIPAPVANFTSDKTSGIVPLTVNFTNTSTDATSYAWDFNNDGTIDSTDANPSWTYNTAGIYTVKLTASGPGGSDDEIKTGYITVNPQCDLTITLVNTTPGSAVFAGETNNVTATVKNNGPDTANNILVYFYVSDVNGGATKIGEATIASIASGKTAVASIVDPTIRNITSNTKYGSSVDTVSYTAVADPNNIIPETDETNNSKVSTAKPVYYNGYKGKRYEYNGVDITDGNISNNTSGDINTQHVYDLRGDIVYYTQPDSAYKAVGWSNRTETWTTSNLSIPTTGTVQDAWLYLAYNWDYTSEGYPLWTITFNGTDITNKYSAWYIDQSNFGGYANYKYGLMVFNVTSLFNHNGDNNLVMTSLGDTHLALYPSTLAVIYSDPNATRKQIFINEQCDELGLSATSYGTTVDEATAYAPFTGMTIDTANVKSATLSSFVGSAGPNEGNLLFNGNTMALATTPGSAWQGNPDTSSALVKDVTGYLTSTGNVAAIQGTESGGMDALQQFLVVEYADAAPVADFSATPTIGNAPLNVQFTNTSTGYVTSYAWDFNNDGTIDSTDANPSWTYNTAGTYTVKLTASGPGGSDDEIKTDYITVMAANATIQAAFNGTPISGAVPLTVQFTDESTSTTDHMVNGGFENGSLGWTLSDGQWSVQTGTVHSGTNALFHDESDYYAISQTVNLTGVNTLKYWYWMNLIEGAPHFVCMIDGDEKYVGDPTDGWKQVTVDTSAYSGLHTIWLIMSDGVGDVYVDDISATSQNIITGYAWDFNNDGTTDSTDANPSWTYSAPGTYTVKLTVTNAVGSDDETKTSYITVNAPDLVVTAISPNAGAGAAIFANESNMISVTVKNQGTVAAPASKLDVEINGTHYLMDVPALDANASTTVTVTDPTIRSANDNVPVNATSDPSNTIPETNETNNTYSVNLIVYNNGYKSKRYTGGDDLNTTSSFSGNYDVVYSNGSSAYVSNGWTSYTVNWTAADLPIPAGATVTQARLYQAYTWDQTPGGQPLLNVSFNGNSVAASAWYSDSKGFASYNYPSGLFVYDVTSLFNTTGNTLSITPGTDNNAALYGSYLVVIYQDPKTSYKKIYINDGTDMLCSNPSYSVDNTEATAYANYNDVKITNIGSAQAIAILASANEANNSKFYFNGNEYTGFWTNYNTTTQTGFSAYDVTGTILNGANVAGLQSYNSGSKGDSMVVLNSILVVSYIAPVADFTAIPVNGTAPLTVVFTDASMGAVDSYAWDFDNDGVIDSTDKNPTYIYNTSGTYMAKLTVNGPNGSNSKTVEIIVEPDTTAPVPKADLKGGLYNNTQTVKLTATDDKDPNPKIYYTLNGDTPNTSSTLYTTPISINTTTTLKFIAVDNVGNSSEVQTETYTIDTVAPLVASRDPANNTSINNTGKTITITFSEAIKNGTGWIEILRNGTKVVVKTAVSGNVLYITSNSALVNGTYRVLLHSGCVTDLAGNSLSSTVSYFTVDTVAPKVRVVYPRKGSVIRNTSRIMVVCNETMKMGTGWIELQKTNGTKIAVRKAVSGSTLYIAPVKALSNGTYRVILHGGCITDQAGNRLAGYFSYFTVDTVAPKVRVVYPRKGSVIRNTSRIMVVCNETMKMGTGWIELQKTNGTKIAVRKAVSGSTLYIAPVKALSNGTYRVILHGGCITDQAGNRLAGYLSYFTIKK